MEEAFERGLLSSYEAPLEHYVAGELYGRRVFVDAGATIITKVHDTRHITVALKGTCTVYSQDGSRTIVESPNVFITDPGTQRAIYCHDEVQWLTVHATTLTDIDEIEKSIFCDNLDEYDDREDYRNVLIAHGINEQIARSMSENQLDQIDDIGSKFVEIKESSIQGFGVFSVKDMEVGECIGIARIDDKRTKIGRYCNHSRMPNCQFKICDNVVQSIALKTIKKGEEITVDYRQAFSIANKLRLVK